MKEMVDMEVEGGNMHRPSVGRGRRGGAWWRLWPLHEASGLVTNCYVLERCKFIWSYFYLSYILSNVNKKTI